jgi:hypothetical protein
MILKIEIVPTLKPGEIKLDEDNGVIYAQAMESIINFFKEEYV